MKITKVEISKFRSIDNGSFNFENTLAIVGQNNSGKSAILRALNSFFNPDNELKYFINDTHLYSTKRSIPKITITFSNVPNIAMYNSFITDGKMTVQQEYSKSKAKLEYNILVGGSKQLATDAFIKQLFKNVQFVLIPTERAGSELSNPENSILKILLDSYFSKHTANRDTLTPKVKDTFNYFKKNALRIVTEGIESNYQSNKSFKINIDTNIPLSYHLFINDLSIKINEGGKEFAIGECGSGIQSLTTIAIYKYLAKLTHTNFIIGIEEPEINLHPQAQKEFINSLINDTLGSNSQIIFTTHSTVFIDQLEHSEVLLVRKVTDQQRGFKSKIYQVPKDFWTTHNLENINYYKFYKYKNSEFFFADHVIIAESSTDSEIFKLLALKNNINIEVNGISILELGGIKSLKYPFYLFKYLEIPKTIIVDKDFFFEYQNGDKDSSRNSNGFFKYKSNYKNEPLINEILNNSTDKTQIELLLKSNHSKSLELLEKYDLICMNFNLEMDLMASTNAQQIFYNHLSIPTGNRTTSYLLNNHDKQIKKIDILVHVVNNLPYKNYPNSYKRFVRKINKLKKNVA